LLVLAPVRKVQWKRKHFSPLGFQLQDPQIRSTSCTDIQSRKGHQEHPPLPGRGQRWPAHHWHALRSTVGAAQADRRRSSGAGARDGDGWWTWNV